MSHWKITKIGKDALGFGEKFDAEMQEEVGTEGPRDHDNAPMPYKFRMLTDDDEVIYYGVCSEKSFDPLDHFGDPNYGCTNIQYLDEEENAYKTL